MTEILSAELLRDRNLASRWIAAGYGLTRLPVNPDADRGVQTWIPELLSEHGSLPPVGMVIDLGRLFSGVTLRQTMPLPVVSERLRAALRSYEDHVLGRIGASPQFETIRDIVATLSSDMQSRATILLIQRVLVRIGFTTGVNLSPGLVRDIACAPKEETMQQGLEALNESGEVVDALTASIEELTQKARRCAELLLPSDAFLVQNVAVLGDLTDRLFIQQLSEVESAFRLGLPKRIKPRRVPLLAKLSTTLAAEEEYPAGGFSSISTSGSLENLVISELIYMEDESSTESSAVDLFDLRYAEGELLYYTRDDAVFHRDHRVIQFVLRADLQRVRIKDDGVQWQRIVVALGLIVCAVERLCDWLGSEQGLKLRIAFVSDHGTFPLASEQKVLALLLGDWVERGVLEFTRPESTEEILSELAECSQGSEVDLIDFTTNPIAMDELPTHYQCVQLSLGSPNPTLHWRNEMSREQKLGGVGWVSWQHLAMQLFSGLV